MEIYSVVPAPARRLASAKQSSRITPRASITSSLTIPHRIQLLIDEKQMDVVTPAIVDVAVRRKKALASNKDARIPAISPDNAISLGYQAAMQAASALLEMAGYRTRGSTGGHHHNTFYAVAALRLPVSKISTWTRNASGMRSSSFYAVHEAKPSDVKALVNWLDSILPAMRGALIGFDASLENVLIQL